MAGQANDLAGDIARLQNEIDAAVEDGAARHAGVRGRALLLRDRDARFRFDRLKAERAVGAAAGQQHSNGPRLLNSRQRPEQMVDRHVLAGQRRARRQVQLAVGQGHVGIRRNQINVIDFDFHPLTNFIDRQRSHVTEDVG